MGKTGSSPPRPPIAEARSSGSRLALGAFLVFVRERTPERSAPLDEVRGIVSDAVAADRGRRAIAEAVKALRPHYIVVRDDRA